MANGRRQPAGDCLTSRLTPAVRRSFTAPWAILVRELSPLLSGVLAPDRWRAPAVNSSLESSIHCRRRAGPHGILAGFSTLRSGPLGRTCATWGPSSLFRWAIIYDRNPPALCPSWNSLQSPCPHRSKSESLMILLRDETVGTILAAYPRRNRLPAR